jgi:hypothetical protein
MAEDWIDEAIDRWMRERPAPAAPRGFAASVMTRVRQERWRAERYWDIGFNIALAGGLTLIVAGVLGLIYMSGLAAVGRDTILFFGSAITTVADQVAPVLPAYIGSSVLVATGLGLWWYVENY